MRLLSFLSEIEHAIIVESPAINGGAWESSRMVNFQEGLGRVALSPRAPAELPLPGGMILLQAFALADGSQCLRATLTWNGSPLMSVMAVYSTPETNWTLEASKIASAWMEGPPAQLRGDTGAGEGLTPLSAVG